MKEHDLEKIAHYAELAWTMSGGEIIRNKMIGDHQSTAKDVLKGLGSVR